MYGTSNTVFGNSPLFSGGTTTGSHNPMKDVEIVSPPDDSVSCLAFSPACLTQDFLIAGSWDSNVCCRRKSVDLPTHCLILDNNEVRTTVSSLLLTPCYMLL